MVRMMIEISTWSDERVESTLTGRQNSWKRRNFLRRPSPSIIVLHFGFRYIHISTVCVARCQAVCGPLPERWLSACDLGLGLLAGTCVNSTRLALTQVGPSHMPSVQRRSIASLPRIFERNFLPSMVSSNVSHNFDAAKRTDHLNASRVAFEICQPILPRSASLRARL